MVPELPGAGLALARIANLTLILAGATAYTTLLLTIAPNAQQAGAASMLALALSFAVWCLAFLPGLASERAGLQCYALVALMAAPYVLSTSCAAPWIDMGLVAIAAVIGAIIAMPLVRAMRVLAFVLVLDIAQICLPRPSVAVFDSSLPWLGQSSGPVFLLVIGVGFSIWRSNWAASAAATDAEFMSAQLALLSSRRHEAVRAAQHQSQRRLHETMLNTLFAVGRGVGRSDAELVVETCRADLEHLHTGSRYSTAVPVGRVIADATRVLAGQLSFAESGPGDAMLAPIPAGALRDAIVESLRNVVRHAQTREVAIDTSATASAVVVRIVDHGIGFAGVPLEHFGLTRAIQEPIDILGGSVSVASEPGEGTEVELTLPIEPVTSPPDSLAPVLDIVVGPLSARLAAISPLYYGLATVALVSAQYANWWLLLSAYLAFALCVVAGAVYWDSPRRRQLTALTFAALAAAFLVLLALDPAHAPEPRVDSATAVSFDWLVNCGFAATVVTLLALPPRAYAWLLFALPFAAATAVILLSEDDSITDRFSSLLQALAFMGLAVYAVTTLFRAIEIQRKQALRTWQQVQAAETRTQEDLHWDSTISGVPASVVSLVSDITEGRRDPGDEEVIRAAREEELVLRGYLLEQREEGPEPGAVLRLLARPDPAR